MTDLIIIAQNIFAGLAMRLVPASTRPCLVKPIKEMTRAQIPYDARILVEVGTKRPIEVGYDPYGPFKILWVVTNGEVRRNFLWVTVRKTGIYVAFGAPDYVHTSYHSDGTFQWKSKGFTQKFDRRPPLPNIPEPILIQNAGGNITDEVLDSYDLTRFEDQLVDRVLYLDNRALSDWIYYDVWAVPPFRHGDVALHTDKPAHIHIITHTNPWIEVVIYERREGKK